MKRALILVACLMAVSQAVPVHTEDGALKEEPQNLEDPRILQPQAQIADDRNTADSIFYPVPPPDAFLGFNNFQGINPYYFRNPYGYGLPFNYGLTSGYGLPVGYGLPSGYSNPFVRMSGLNQLYSGYSYPPIIINLPRRQA